MNAQTPFVILSAERPEWDTSINAQRSDLLRRQLEVQGHSPVPVNGHYKGTAEQSWLVFLDDDSYGAKLDHIIKLARRYGQESILYVDSSRQAELLYVGTDDNKLVYGQSVGQWKRLNEVANEDSYSEIEGAYYATA